MYDENYIKAETAYRAQRIRDEIVGRQERLRLRRARDLIRKGHGGWTQ